MRKRWIPGSSSRPGRCKSWTLDSGLDRGLDGGLDFGPGFGPDFGPNFWPSFGFIIITLARLFRLTSHRYALPVYGLAMFRASWEKRPQLL